MRNYFIYIKCDISDLKFNTCFGAVISIVYDLCFMNIILRKVNSKKKEGKLFYYIKHSKVWQEQDYGVFVLPLGISFVWRR